MSLEFIIDTRERELITNLISKKCVKENTKETKDDLFQSEITEVKFNVSQLDLGDIVFKKGDDVILVIERKTIKDLKASICDGRAREQKARLIGNYPKNRILYLIEGCFDKPLDYSISGMDISTLIGSMINMQLRDNIKVYKTSSIDETAHFLIKLYNKLEKDGKLFFKDSQEVNYTQSLKKCKKANMTPSVWFNSQLSLIPQVTSKVADVIMEKYPTLFSLFSEYEKTPEHLRTKLLADLRIPSGAEGKTRRLGDKMSETIYNFFYGKQG